MGQISHRSNRAASVRVARVAYFLHQAAKQLSAASHSAPDRYHQQRLLRLLADLRELSLPLAGLVSSLGRGGER